MHTKLENTIQQIFCLLVEMPSQASKAVESFSLDLTSEHLSSLYDIVPMTIWIIELWPKMCFLWLQWPLMLTLKFKSVNPFVRVNFLGEFLDIPSKHFQNIPCFIPCLFYTGTEFREWTSCSFKQDFESRDWHSLLRLCSKWAEKILV